MAHCFNDQYGLKSELCVIAYRWAGTIQSQRWFLVYTAYRIEDTGHLWWLRLSSIDGNVLRSTQFGLWIDWNIIYIYQLRDNIHPHFHQWEVQMKRFSESLADRLFNLWWCFRFQFYNSVVTCKLLDNLVIASTTYVVIKARSLFTDQYNSGFSTD